MSDEAPHHAAINTIALDRDGGHYVYWVNRLTVDDLHSKGDIAAVLAWYRHELADDRAKVERLHERLDSALGQAASLIAQNKQLRETVNEYNQLLRSTAQIAARSGESVEWASFTRQVAICLARNHPVWLSAVAAAIDEMLKVRGEG